jgi:transposase InsO family protein
MVERFNGRIEEMLLQTRFTNAQHLEQSIEDYATLYNHHIPQKSLDHHTPLQAMQQVSSIFHKRDA